MRLATRLSQNASFRFAKQVPRNSSSYQAIGMLPARREPFLPLALVVTKHCSGTGNSAHRAAMDGIVHHNDIQNLIMCAFIEMSKKLLEGV